MAGCPASERVAECDNEPLLPRAVIMKLPVAAVDIAPRTMEVFAPAAMLSGPAGFDTTPVGRPASVTWTAAVKPFWPLIEMVIEPVAPCQIESELDESVIAKAEGGTGGG